ncbi:MAG TPA: SprT-like domain-containing protein [Pyrinomonadaceae bacterium]|nr:SprT-like domain-containing protein [Pyrinomonadaceae bacterium]
MPDSQPPLGTLFAEAFRQLAPKRAAPEVDARYYPYAGLNHTIRVRSGRVYVRLSDIFRGAPPGVHRALAFILVAKLLRRKTPPFYEKVYRDYAYAPEVLRASDLARRRRGRKLVSTAQGRVYDLGRMFRRLNQRYFDGGLEQPTLTWSRRRTRTILGHHDGAHDTIVISKTLDSEDVPEWFVEYILYHEMLHIKHPARLINGRRYYHTKAFRAEEQRFPFYREAQQWLDHIALQRRTLQRARAA